MSSERKQESLVKGIFWILFSSFGFAMMAVLVKASGDVPFVQKTMFRNLIAFFISFGSLLMEARKDRSVLHVEKKAWKFLIMRSFFGSFGIFGNFYAIGYMYVSDATMLNKIAPFAAVIGSFFIVGEKPGKLGVIALVTAFIGALFVIKPSFDFSRTFPALCGLVGGLGAGFAYACVRKMHTYNVNGKLIIAFFSFFSCMISLPSILFFYEPMTLSQLLILLGAGVSAACGQFGITFAYFNAPASKISIFEYSNVIFAAIISFFLFGMIPDCWSITGYVIIIGTALFVFLYNNSNNSRAKKENTGISKAVRNSTGENENETEGK